MDLPGHHDSPAGLPRGLRLGQEPLGQLQQTAHEFLARPLGRIPHALSSRWHGHRPRSSRLADHSRLPGTKHGNRLRPQCRRCMALLPSSHPERRQPGRGLRRSRRRYPLPPPPRRLLGTSISHHLLRHPQRGHPLHHQWHGTDGIDRDSLHRPPCSLHFHRHPRRRLRRGPRPHQYRYPFLSISG